MPSCWFMMPSHPDHSPKGYRTTGKDNVKFHKHDDIYGVAIRQWKTEEKCFSTYKVKEQEGYKTEI